MTLAIANEALSEPSRKCGSQVPVSVGRAPVHVDRRRGLRNIGI